MPTYTYRCKDCGYQFEKRQRMAEDPLTECPVCDGRIRRVVNSVGIVFKGSGFYVTDNRNGSGANGKSKVTASQNGQKDENITETKSGETAPTTSETKPKKKESSPAA